VHVVVTLEIRPITLRAAQAFIALHHRHNAAPRGHKFSVGVYDEQLLVGVAVASRPVARALDDGLTLEVTRTCTIVADNANSMLYGAVWRAAKAMGYRRCITYTQGAESGGSIKGAGFRKAADLPARGSWKDSSVKLAHLRSSTGDGGVERARWEITA